MTGETLGEWQAFERYYGPLLVHDRLDFGLTYVRALLGDKEPHTPWNRPQEQDGDALHATLSALADKWKAKEV